MKKNLKRYFKLLISIILSGAILFLIYKRMDFSQLSAAFRQIRLLPTILFLVSFIPQFYLASLRWKVITHRIGGVRQTLFTSFKQVVGSYSANLIIPGKMGEFVRIPWMRKLPMKAPVLILVLLEKSLDLLSVITNLLVFLIIYLMITPAHLPVLDWIALALGLILLFVLLIYLLRRKISRWVEKRFSGYLSRKDEKFFYFRFKEVVRHLDRNIGWYLLISLLLWLVQGFEFFIIFWMFGVKVPLISIYTGCFLALLAGAIPVSIAGLGPRDAVIITFYKNIAPYETLAGVGLLSLSRVIIAAVVGLPFFFLQTKE